MGKYIKILFVSLFVCIELTVQSVSQAKTNIEVEKTGDLAIVINEQKLSETIFMIDYEIRNNCSTDVWICASVDESFGDDFETYKYNDTQTLVVRRRLDVPTFVMWDANPYGKYVRLRPGERRAESVSLLLPVQFRRVYMASQGKKEIEYIIHVAIEIGYYVGDLPKMFINMLSEMEKTDIDKFVSFKMLYGDVLSFNYMNELLIKRREDEVLIPYTRQEFKGEDILRAVIDDIKIPYIETFELLKINPPDMNSCIKLEIQYQPSMLEYFFPYKSQHSLFTRQEIEYLKSQNSIVIEDKKVIDEFANELKQTGHIEGGIVSEKSKANVTCYQGSRQVTSFIVYDDSCLENKQNQRIKYRGGLQSLRKCTPQIQSFELRMCCAYNLQNLWSRLKLYDRKAKRCLQFYSNLRFRDQDPNNPPKSGPIDKAKLEESMKSFRDEQEVEKMRATALRYSINLVYPEPQRWCDAMGWAFAGMRIGSEQHEVNKKMKVHVCPSVVGEGVSTYAMNPDCRYDSPPDMVLLFETKAGWNQHGGPELFTFDNHEPKGGCVLLNDGTVKFIRTEEELHALKWK
jgi:hypothetical protein